MPQYEYMQLSVHFSAYENIVSLLNTHGADGWEVVLQSNTPDYTGFLLKREIVVENTPAPLVFDDKGMLDIDFNEVAYGPGVDLGPEALSKFHVYVDGLGPRPLYCTEDQAAHAAQDYPHWLVFTSEEARWVGTRTN